MGDKSIEMMFFQGGPTARPGRDDDHQVASIPADLRAGARLIMGKLRNAFPGAELEPQEDCDRDGSWWILVNTREPSAKVVPKLDAILDWQLERPEIDSSRLGTLIRHRR